MVKCWVWEAFSSKNRQQINKNIESSKWVWKDKRLLDQLDIIIKVGDSLKTEEWKSAVLQGYHQIFEKIWEDWWWIWLLR